ncbi:HAMP domain-containing histidine kinase [Acutalibacter muris]|uniref:histidine kinase n=1 Tax=Acutalibacter muris TaxID=1796620 RepID=A0A1Z2XRS2_9FIRM|nr:HAMP domain-containing sensor histidine kinase [Acutalibacter muris]ANU55601.1 sensor histidine kinase [Hungateiclostridiaceae bacterium KB18]ASB41162.1 sensor histidine kinase [Acutalibacter muris]QQR30433.1 HAMP domain-containing histidine kinase [Acutalibacter muris]
MTLLFLVVWLILTVVFCLVNSLYVGSIWPTVCYAALSGLVTVGFAMYEKTRRQRLLDDVQKALDGKDDFAARESGLAPLARQLRLKRGQEEARDRRVTQSYRNLAALVSDIAHQCKTPLTATRMYAELLPPSAESAAIAQQASKLQFLLDALVKLSRCEGGLIEENVHPTKESVETLVAQALSAVVPGAERKSIVLSVEIPEGLTALLDMRWTAEALGALLDNSVKYAPENSKITVAAQRYETYIRLDVLDEGPGIPEEELPEIWKRFYRGKMTRGASGVGIGLTLCRMIVQAQGGRVLCQNLEGGGCRFSIFLPAE